jgi:enterochelin esterase-like enzyme
MRKLIILFIVLANVVPLCAQNARIMEGLAMKSSVLNQEVKYSIILPQDYYTSKRSYPVVYLLHGLGDNESSWLEYGRVSATVDAAVKNKEIVPMIYVMPQGFRNYYVNDYAGKFPYMDMFVQELVSYIDQQYRTIADKEHRATLGYSMGGFGALILPLKNPEVFSVSVPLSISVRTDSQYMTEDASGWDEQWGRLFGGVGETGEARLTDYYKQHSPFHIFNQSDLSTLKDLRIYIDNGDDEETLARSNEELHILLRDKNFPHEFRVRDGGHEFVYWRDALTNGLRFISDAVQQKQYRGDVKTLSKPANVAKNNMLVKEQDYDVLLPNEYESTQRMYPVVYVVGTDGVQQNEIITYVNRSIKSQSLTPVITVFVQNQKDISVVTANVESKFRARVGYRFRSLIGIGQQGGAAFTAALTPEVFTSCVLFDVPLDCDLLQNALRDNKKSLAKTWFFINTTDKSVNYKNNGCAHIALRGEYVYHEYRVQEGNADAAWFRQNLKEAFDFTQRKIHR